MITDQEIREHYVIPALGEFAADYDVEAITAELLDRHPRSEWVYSGLQYSHPSGCPDFWDIAAEWDTTERS